MGFKREESGEQLELREVKIEMLAPKVTQNERYSGPRVHSVSNALHTIRNLCSFANF